MPYLLCTEYTARLNPSLQSSRKFQQDTWLVQLLQQHNNGRQDKDRWMDMHWEWKDSGSKLQNNTMTLQNMGASDTQFPP
jgi:hypothetical protein